MKNIFSALLLIAILNSCTKQQFSDHYTDPSKVYSSSIEKQFAGFLAANLQYTMYRYNNYFVTLQNTILPWTQSVGIINNIGRYVPGAAAIGDRWANYYAFVAQYKELLRLNNSVSTEEQKDKRIYLIAAAIYFYDHTQKIVDLHGNIPWSAAGLLSTLNGDYINASAKYDKAPDIYNKMLDDLKGFADELNGFSLSDQTKTTTKTQDFINHGDLDKWKKYCNSLRVRLLSRVSAVPSFQSRVAGEMAAILGNPTAYPLVLKNEDNILIRVTDISSARDPRVDNGQNTGDNSDFYLGLIGWGNADIAGKVMIDTMVNNMDPRLRAMFEPGKKALPAGTYYGLDPSLGNDSATKIANSGFIARYNRSSISQNKYLPGMLINAAEVNFLLSEYYLNKGNDGLAQAAYEKGINQSIDYYFWIRTISNESVSGPLTATSQTEKDTYINNKGIAWSTAATNNEKLNKIAIQKWINYNVLQPIECWAEIRRLKLPALNFVADVSGQQMLPPNRWVLPANEITYNSINYQTEAATDKLTSKIFWDTK